MVVEYIHPVSAVPSILVLTVSEPFLEPFLGIWAILDRFSLFRATADPLNTPCMPSDGVREALGTHFGRPRPWAWRGWVRVQV
jgi:hypothetical protein